MDENILAIKPIKAEDDEKDGIRHQVQGQRRCIVVVPKVATPGKPWSWRGCYWDHHYPKEGTYITCRGPGFTECYDRYAFELPGVEGAINVIVPQTTGPGRPWVFRADYVSRESAVDLALLAKGFHIVTGPVPYNADGPILAHWNTVYKHLTDCGFSKRPVMAGGGGAAGEAYAWAIENPEKVSCIYAANPAMHSNLAKTQPLDNLAPLAKAGVQLLHVCGSLDPWLKDNTRMVEKRYQELGGQITVIIDEGVGHYPLGPTDPKSVVDFIIQRAN
jgi:hypothetical protein